MKHLLVMTLVSVGLIVGPTTVASAATPHTCAQLRAIYPGGVAKKGVTFNTNQYTGDPISFVHKPRFSTALYKKYSFMDRDNDGIACEG